MDDKSQDRVAIGEALDLSEFAEGAIQADAERGGLPDPGTVHFDELTDPTDLEADPNAVLGATSQSAGGISVGAVGPTLGSLAAEPELAEPELAEPLAPAPTPSEAHDAHAPPAEPETDGPGSWFRARGALVFSESGELLDEDPTLGDGFDAFEMESAESATSAPVTMADGDDGPAAAADLGALGTESQDVDPMNAPTEDVAEPVARPAARPAPEPAPAADEAVDLEDPRAAARRLVAGDATTVDGETGAEPTELERAQALLERQLLRAMARRLNAPEWYLTGVEVGLKSLHRLYESSRLVYANERVRSTGVRKVENLRVVYEQLLKFRTADGPLERGRILIGYRNQFEDLLGDLQEGRRRSRGLASTELTLYEQVAKDLTEAVNRQRTYHNLIRAIESISKLPKMMQRSRDKKVDALVTGYRQILASLDWNDAEGFRSKGQMVHKVRQLRDRIRRSRRHLQQVRDELYKDKPHAIDNPETPELDLDARKVIPFLRRDSKDGLDYLSRAFSVYEHALESSAKARELVARVEELEAAAREADAERQASSF